MYAYCGRGEPGSKEGIRHTHADKEREKEKEKVCEREREKGTMIRVMTKEARKA